MEKKVMLIPSYMNEFKCIGSECSDSCCVGWKVSIDKKSYKNYRTCKNKNFREKLDKNIKRDRKNTNDLEYAKIILNEKNECPFLNDKKLCEIYLEMGEKYMSNTCTIYPRIYNEVDNILEKSLNLSCPEAARIILDNENLMSFEEVPYDGEKYFVNTRIETRIENYLAKYFWNLRVAAIDIMQNRNYSIDERIIIIGLLCDEINNTINSGNHNEILNIIEKYINRVERGEYIEFLKQIPSNIEIKVKLVRIIEGIKLTRGTSGAFLKIMGKGLQGLGCVEDATNEEIKSKYLNCKENYDKSLEEKYNYIIENYLVNHLFKNTFPLTKRNNIFAEYIYLCIYYALIKFNLIGLSNEKELEKEEIIEFIQKFSKGIEHDTDYINILWEGFNKSGLSTLAYMSVLIKN